MFCCVMGVVFFGACGYWAVFELEIPEMDVMARLLRVMIILFAIIAGCACALGAILWGSYLKDEQTRQKQKNLFE